MSDNLVDQARLCEWMDKEGLGAGPLENLKRLTGGTQNILLSFSRAGRPYVLRHPPKTTIADGDETMRREARVLAAIADTDVPHARLIAACGDPGVIGAAFYLMEPVDGFNATVALPPLHAGDPAIRRQMGFEIVDAVAKLGRVDAIAVGLSDFGKVENFLTRQTSRWKSQLDGYARFTEWDGPDALPGVDVIGHWLETNCPASFTPGIMHGDYHLANVMYRNDGPQIAAIVDWELATLGDPLIDLGWLLATWPGDDVDQARLPVTPWDGFPEADELVEYYAAHSSRDMNGLLWYKVLACYKLGILLEGTYARAAAGKADPGVGRMLHDQTIFLFQRALRWLEQNA
ncbi:MAG: phosphotransferase family protein [Parasphingorhabdus sp.]|uniref:phosphotransferase family protein n=1 Tax=Parasphingorhabdus sp. TaxID=2709688 RepID=UPI0030033A3D